jgi:hypothetical protein
VAVTVFIDELNIYYKLTREILIINIFLMSCMKYLRIVA